MTIFGITLGNAFKQVPTSLVLVHSFVKYTLKFQKFKAYVENYNAN